MGTLSNVLIGLFKAQPFESEALDQLATKMNVTTLLKKEKNQRYYLSQTLAMPCASTQDTLIFNSKFYNMLEPIEILAVAAHEFSHTTKKHTKTRLSHIMLPAVFIAFLVGGLLATNPFSVPLLSTSLPLAAAVLFSFVLMLLVSFHVNSGMLRRQETECDLNAMDYVSGEAVISVLVKTNAVYVQSKLQVKLSKMVPKTHPTTEQRINDIKGAIDRKKPDAKLFFS